MTNPAWAPPELPDAPVAPEEPEGFKWIAFALAGVAVLLVVLVAVVFLVVPRLNEKQPAVQLVDDTIEAMVGGDWQAAFEAFDETCSDGFDVALLKDGFEPVLAPYESHDTRSPELKGSPEIDEPIRVTGTLDLGQQFPSTFRAEVLFKGTEAPAAWSLCTLRIEEARTESPAEPAGSDAGTE